MNIGFQSKPTILHEDNFPLDARRMDTLRPFQNQQPSIQHLLLSPITFIALQNQRLRMVSARNLLKAKMPLSSGIIPQVRHQLRGTELRFHCPMLHPTDLLYTQVTATQELILRKTLTFCTNQELSIHLTTTRLSVIHPLSTSKRSLIWIRSFQSLHNPTPVILKAEDLMTISFPTQYWMKRNYLTFQKLRNL